MQTLRGEASGQRPRIMVHHASLRKRELPVHYADYSVARPKEYESKGSAGCAMKVVYLLWSAVPQKPTQDKHLEEIFTQKIDAEKAIREFKDADKQSGASYHYWIQEREVHLGGTK
jgi:hypothetical protein